MQTPLAMTIIGPDRTGLVESVARAVADHGGNWLESRMCRLGGEFAGILRIEIPAEKKAPLMAALEDLQENGLQIVVRDDKPAAAALAGKQTKLEIVGSDRPGIVREITSALARANVNVEEFFSEVVSAPMSGETLFKASARLQLPQNCDLAALKRDLEKIAADLLVDVSFAELTGK
jgi:glycine cleavage system regulatory protein